MKSEYYEVTKKKKMSQEDDISQRFNHLIDARKHGVALLRCGNFKELKNSKGILLTL